MVNDPKEKLNPNGADGHTDSDEDAELGGTMSFLEHLQELRERLIRSLAAFTIAAAVCFMFSNELIKILLKPIPQEYQELSIAQQLSNVTIMAEQLEAMRNSPQSATEVVQSIIQSASPAFNFTKTRGGARVMATHPIESLIAQLKVSLIAGLFLAFPFIFYEAWMFIAPGLYKRERRAVLPLVLSAWFCFIGGGMFAYFIIYGFALAFFATMTPDGVVNMWSLKEYLTFTTHFLLAFCIIFQEPVVITLLARIGLVTSDALRKFRPYAIVLMFTIGAIITPPDPISQTMCSIPLCLLYELSIYIVRMIERKREILG